VKAKQLNLKRVKLTYKYKEMKKVKKKRKKRKSGPFWKIRSLKMKTKQKNLHVETE